MTEFQEFIEAVLLKEKTKIICELVRKEKLFNKMKGDDMTLLKETLEDVKRSGRKIEDIIFIGSEASGHSCTWKEFEELADREYDSGYGGQEVASDLIISFSDGSKMWRGEYDGSEWWEYSTPFKVPKDKKPIKNLFARIGWSCLKDIDERG